MVFIQTALNIERNGLLELIDLELKELEKLGYQIWLRSRLAN